MRAAPRIGRGNQWGTARTRWRGRTFRHRADGNEARRTESTGTAASSQFDGRRRSSRGDVAARGATSQLEGRRRSFACDGASGTRGANVLTLRIAVRLASDTSRPRAHRTMRAEQPQRARQRDRCEANAARSERTRDCPRVASCSRGSHLPRRTSASLGPSPRWRRATLPLPSDRAARCVGARGARVGTPSRGRSMPHGRRRGRPRGARASRSPPMRRAVASVSSLAPTRAPRPPSPSPSRSGGRAARAARSEAAPQELRPAPGGCARPPRGGLCGVVAAGRRDARSHDGSPVGLRGRSASRSGCEVVVAAVADGRSRSSIKRFAHLCYPAVHESTLAGERGGLVVGRGRRCRAQRMRIRHAGVASGASRGRGPRRTDGRA